MENEGRKEFERIVATLTAAEGTVTLGKMPDETVFAKDLLKHAVKTFKTMKPFGDFLNGALDDYA